MNDMNKVFEIGRIVRDAEKRFTSNNKAICKFTIAVNERRRDGEDYKDVANFFDVMVWGKLADSLHKYLTKGKQVAIEGKLKQDRWDDNGQTRSRIIIEAAGIQLLSDGRSDSKPLNQTTQCETRAPAQSENHFGDNVPF